MSYQPPPYDVRNPDQLAELRAALAGMKVAFLGAAAERDTLRAEVERLKAKLRDCDQDDDLGPFKPYIERIEARLKATLATLAEREAETERLRADLEFVRDVNVQACVELNEARAALEECAGHPKCRAALATARAEALEEGARFADQMAESWAGMAAQLVAAKQNPADIANCRGVMEGSITIAAKLRALASDTKGET